MVTPPPKKGDELTRGGTSSGRMGQIVTAANRWRENYNPLRSLTMRRVVELFELAQRGDTAYLQWTFRFIERRYPTLSALISRCESPMMAFDWDIKIKDDVGESDMAKAEAQREQLRKAYEQIDNLKEAILHLHLAQFRGYAHLQKHRDPDGSIIHLEPLNQWCICRDGMEGNWWWNPDSRSTSTPLQFLGKGFCIGGDTLPLDDFIIRVCPRPIDEIGLVNFLRANLCEKDWDGFIEIYGIPGGVVIMPPNVPQGKEAEYEAAARQIAEGGSGALPNGSDYEANDGPQGVDPFTPRLQHLDEQLILAGTGGKLTMLAESGSGTLAGGAHADTFAEIAEARAQEISELFQRHIDAEILGEDDRLLVYFKFGKPDEDSAETVGFKREFIKGCVQNAALSPIIAKLTDIKETAHGAGLPVNDDYEPEEDLEKLGAASQVPNPNTPTAPPKPGEEPDPADPREAAETIRNRLVEGTDNLAEALGDDLGHVLQRLQSILDIQDDQIFAKKLKSFLEDFDQLRQDILADPTVARALEPLIQKAFLQGLKAK